MIERESGAVRFDDGARIEPSITRSAFLASKLAARAREGMQNEPWCAWVLPEIHAGGRPFRVTICFSDERLGMVELMLLGPEFPTGWKDASAAKERARKAAHDALLEPLLGAPAARTENESSWTLGACELVSRFDPRAISSAIHLRYGWEKDEEDDED